MTVINNSGGSIIRVTDSELMDAVSFLAQSDGIFASPAGVSSIAGLFKLIESNGIDDYDENIVCIVTMGHGSSSNDVLKNWKTLDAINKIRYQRRQIIKRGSISEKNKKISSYPIGNTKTRILSLLKNYPDYAYNLHKRTVKKYSLKIDISTLYQHLNELEKMGAISKSKAESFQGKPIRIYYDITPYGSSLISSNSFKKN
jgi:DNA-binding transcriptional ArsR family regulator